MGFLSTSLMRNIVDDLCSLLYATKKVHPKSCLDSVAIGEPTILAE